VTAYSDRSRSLSPERLAEVREALARGEGAGAVAARLGVARGTVAAIAEGRTYRQDGGADPVAARARAARARTRAALAERIAQRAEGRRR
jgi:hypothetical protein